MQGTSVAYCDCGPSQRGACNEQVWERNRSVRASTVLMCMRLQEKCITDTISLTCMPMEKKKKKSLPF